MPLKTMGTALMKTTLTLAEAGKYVGPDDIREYIQFTFAEYSPYIYSSPINLVDTMLRTTCVLGRWSW